MFLRKMLQFTMSVLLIFKYQNVNFLIDKKFYNQCNAFAIFKQNFEL